MSRTVALWGLQNICHQPFRFQAWTQVWVRLQRWGFSSSVRCIFFPWNQVLSCFFPQVLFARMRATVIWVGAPECCNHQRFCLLYVYVAKATIGSVCLRATTLDPGGMSELVQQPPSEHNGGRVFKVWVKVSFMDLLIPTGVLDARCFSSGTFCKH